MRRYKYLDDLGVDRHEQMDNWIRDTKFDRRSLKWRKQRRVYGIDERSTWSWADEYMDYVYIHLKMFNKVNNVAFDRMRITFKGNDMSIQEAIDTILDWFETQYYPDREEVLVDLISKYSYDIYVSELMKYSERKQEILHLFSVIIPYLTW